MQSNRSDRALLEERQLTTSVYPKLVIDAVREQTLGDRTWLGRVARLRRHYGHRYVAPPCGEGERRAPARRKGGSKANTVLEKRYFKATTMACLVPRLEVHIKCHLNYKQAMETWTMLDATLETKDSMKDNTLFLSPHPRATRSSPLQYARFSYF